MKKDARIIALNITLKDGTTVDADSVDADNITCVPDKDGAIAILDQDGAIVATVDVMTVDDPKLPPIIAGPTKDDAKPPWTDQERVRDWTVTWLEAMDKAITDGPPMHPLSLRRLADDPEERAITEAKCGNMEPLWKLYPKARRGTTPLSAQAQAWSTLQTFDHR
jgi:hypothetical protein